MDDKQLKEIEARCEAATEGPWNIWDGPAYAGGGGDLCIGSGKDWVANMDHRIAGHHDRFHDVDLCDICSGITEEQRFNAEFIAHARDDVPALIQAIRDKDRKIAQLEDGIAAAVTDMNIMRAEKRERDMAVAENEDALRAARDCLNEKAKGIEVLNHMIKELRAGRRLE